jgi:hypothetical protein
MGFWAFPFVIGFAGVVEKVVDLLANRERFQNDPFSYM